MDIRLDGIDTRLAQLTNQHNEQGQDVKEMERHLDSIDRKLELVLQQLARLTKLPE